MNFQNRFVLISSNVGLEVTQRELNGKTNGKQKQKEVVMIGARARLYTNSGNEKLYNLLPIKNRSTFSQLDYNNTTFVHTVTKKCLVS